LPLYPAAQCADNEDMAEIAVILVAAGLFIAGFVAWYTMWHRRMVAAFERVRVGTDISTAAPQFPRRTPRRA
jgi:hypothetical protein